MKNHLISVFLLFLISTACKKDADNTPKTYDLTGQFQTVSTPLSAGPNQQMSITGSGNVNPLGQTSFEASTTIVLTPPPPFNISGTATFTVEGQGTFSTMVTGTSAPQPDGLFLVLLQHTIVSGTGKFKDATGHLNGTAYTDREDPNGIISLEGKITY